MGVAKREEILCFVLLNGMFDLAVPNSSQSRPRGKVEKKVTVEDTKK